MENYYVPPKNWFQRNWKWFVPTGCLSLIIIVVLVVVIAFKGITSMVKNSDVYVHTMEVAYKNKAVTEKIGTPIEENGLPSGGISTSNNTGIAVMEIRIKGPKGEGMLRVEAEKRNNTWTYQVMNFYPKDSTEAIDLLEHPSTE